MNVSMYQATSAKNALSQWEEAIAQKLSVTSTPGYRKTVAPFDTLVGLRMPADELDELHFPGGRSPRTRFHGPNQG